MEPIKIQVNVTVDLSKTTQDFLSVLFTTPKCGPAPIVEPEKSNDSQSVAATEAPISQPVAPAQPAKSATPVPSQPAAQAVSSASKTIEEVRKALVEKVNEHRDAIKQKLTELGAPSVTKLDPRHYDEMFNFLKSL